jgi:hypothetical protein
METQTTLTKVYRSSSLVIMPLMLVICLVFKWHWLMIGLAMLASAAISSPATISLHLMMWLFRKRTVERSFVWILLFALIPLLSLITACFFVDYVPGKVWFLLLLGMLSGYVGILTHVISVAQFFNSKKDERG